MTTETRTAIFSDDGMYRYTLSVIWKEGGSMVQFIGLNPSTADQFNDDPTLRRVKDFAKQNGFGGLVMTNLFAYRSTNPNILKKVANPIGEIGVTGNRNDHLLLSVHSQCALTIACWGTHGTLHYRNVKVKQMIPGMKCLRLTSRGHPEHPLYLPKTCVPIDFQ